MERLFYFGTSLSQAGHYFWHLHGGSMDGHGLRFPTGQDMKNWPFNPETILDEAKNRPKKKGDVVCAREGRFTIIAIEGSCTDNRWGSKSVFFTDEHSLYKDLAIEMVQLPIVQAILKQCKFEINWPFYEEINAEIRRHFDPYKTK